MFLNIKAIQKSSNINEYDFVVNNENVGLGILQQYKEYSQNTLGGISTINNQWILNLKYGGSNLNMGFYYVNITQSTTPSKEPIVSKFMVTYITGKDTINIMMDNFYGSIVTSDNINYEIFIYS